MEKRRVDRSKESLSIVLFFINPKNTAGHKKERRGEVVERKALFSKVWETNYTDDTRTLDVHVSWLRQAIEANPDAPQFLKTIRGVGYRLDV